MHWHPAARPFGRAVVVGFGVLALAMPARAQLRIGWDVSAAASQFQPLAPSPLASSPLAPSLPTGSADARWLGQRSLGTMLRYDLPYGQFGADGLVRDGDVATHATGGVHALVAPPAWRGWRLSGVVDARHTPNDGAIGTPLRDPNSLALWVAPAPRLPAWGATVSARLSYSRGVNGVWLSASDRSGAVMSDSLSARYLTAGYSRQLGDLILGISLGSQSARTPGTPATIRDSISREPYDSLGHMTDTIAHHAITDAGMAGGIRRLSEIAGRLGWGRGRFAFDAVLNARPRVQGLPSAVWGEANGVAALGSHLAFVAGMRTAAPLPGIALSARRVVNLGLRIAPAALLRPVSAIVLPVTPVARAFALQPAAPGEYTVSLRLPNARVVELAGDFTGWNPVRLRQIDATHWEVTLAVAAGAHRCNVRVDGAEWVPPPGITAVDDEFNGRVGIFVVE
jgi:hypothetical protein